MKKIAVIFLILCIIFSLSACNSTGSGNDIIGASKKVDYTDPSIYTIDTLVSMGIEQERTVNQDVQSAADKLLDKIENIPDTLKPHDNGKYIYVANDGTDGKGFGYSADAPVATIEYANLLAKEGDVVLLKRGNMWRTRVIGKEGVSYGAYGKGNKPTIYGAPKNAAEEEWTKEGGNIYKVQSGTGADIGLIVFDHGKAFGNKKFIKGVLRNDFDFYCSGGYVYVYSSKGDPSKLFDDIEICPTEHIVQLKSNSTIQNWRIMYGGAHGVSMSNVSNVAFEGCVIGYIGGGRQGGMDSNYVRYGNGIEVWGSCDGYTIKNCHVFQCYDAGITMQFQGATDKTIIEQNILFEGNLLELNNYNIEYFLTPVPNGDSCFRNVQVKDNIIRGGGYGWGYYSRGDKDYGTNIMSGGTSVSENFVYTNNMFEHAKCILLTLRAGDLEHLPKFEGNTYVQYEKVEVLERNGYPYFIKKYGKEIYTDVLGDKTAKITLY